MAKTRKVRRGSRRLRKMRGSGLFNTMKAKASNVAGRAKSLVTPSQAKQNWLKNKYNTAKAVGSLAKEGVKGIGRGTKSFLGDMASGTSGKVLALGAAGHVALHGNKYLPSSSSYNVGSTVRNLASGPSMFNGFSNLF